MPHVVASASSSKSKKAKGKAKHDGIWKVVTMMNMRDLSRDDDLLSHFLVEKLGTGGIPLVVHKMDPHRRLPKSDADQLLQIVRRLIAFKGPRKLALTRAVEELLTLPPVRWYLTQYKEPRQINAFATHASRYFELYLPGGYIEIAHTSRYADRTGKSELCILATRPLAKGQVIEELKGSMADLSPEEDQELKRVDETNADGVNVRRDFSVIHSKQLKKNHLFLGPARFVNHDCNHNVELFRTGRYITFRVRRPIAVGEEVTANYGDGYFGRNNRHCLCASCEMLGRGAYRPNASPSEDDEDLTDSGPEANDRGSVSERSLSGEESDADESNSVNLNERRTRRGVYAVVAEEEPDTPMALDADLNDESEKASTPISQHAGSSRQSSVMKKGTGLLTPDPEPSSSRGRSRGRSVISLSASSSPPPFRSTISTRSRTAREASAETSISTSHTRGKEPDVVAPARGVSINRQLVTPPLTANGSADSIRSSSRLKSRRETSTADVETATSYSNSSRDKGKGKATTSSVSDGLDVARVEPEGRSLRPRAAALAGLAEDELAKKMKGGPRGFDGKPLPTCITCKNILPVISIENEVVWGHSVGRTGKRGRPRKHAETECPRCIRHFAIYNCKWPDRTEPDGGAAFETPPPVSTKAFVPIPLLGGRLSKEELAALERGLPPPSLSISVNGGSKHTLESDSDMRPAKKQKQSTGRPRGRPPKNKVGMSAKAKEMLQKAAPAALINDERRSGRTRIPTFKVRENEPPLSPQKSPVSNLRVSPRKNPPSSTVSAPVCGNDDVMLVHDSISAPVRPVTPPPSGSSQDGVLKTPKSLAVASQPREANGRFGRKYSTNGRYVRKKYMMGGRLGRAVTGQRTDPFVEQKRVEDGDREDEHHSDHGSMSDHAPDEDEESLVFGTQLLHNVLGKRSLEDENRYASPSPTPRGSPFESEDIKLDPEDFNNYGTDYEDIFDYDEDDEDELDEDDVEPVTYSCDHSPVVPRIGMSLLSRPNPITFARRKWARADDDASDDSDVMSDEESGSLSTPEVETFRSASAVTLSDQDDHDTEEDEVRYSIPPRLGASFVGALISKPSPVNLARRRWAPPPANNHSSGSRSTSRSITVITKRPSTPPPQMPFEMSIDTTTQVEVVDRVCHQSSPFVPRSNSVDDDAQSAGNIPWWQMEASSEDETNVETFGDNEIKLEYPESEFALDGAAPTNYGDTVENSTDDSERIVESLIALTGSRPPSSLGDSHYSPSQSPHVQSPTPEYSPGLAWKRTVLLPTDEPCNISRPAKPPITIPPFPPASPTKLICAGWDTASSDIDPY